MGKADRFQAAMRRARPAGLRVLEAYSPKLDRRLQCFGEVSFEQWVRLEADPTIQRFCERPLDLQCENGVLHIDFWVRQGDREILLVMEDTCALRSATIGNIELEIVAISSAELAASRMWTVTRGCNWAMIPSLRESTVLTMPSSSLATPPSPTIAL
jgi:hypothetical protein